MVNLGAPTWKLGIQRPNVIKAMNFLNPTGQDKLLMARCRIWGLTLQTHLGNLKRYEGLEDRRKGDAKLLDWPNWRITQNFPYHNRKHEREDKQKVEEEKKFKYMMKGVKVGRKKGGASMSLMSVFEKKK
jgi:hypothetical protein